MTRVLIVDDQPAFRRHLRQLLEAAGLEVVGEAGNIPTAEGLVQEHLPDLAVVDVMLPGINGLAGTRRLRTLHPGLRVFLVSAFRESASLYLAYAREAGAEGFYPKDDLDLELVQGWVSAPEE